MWEKAQFMGQAGIRKTSVVAVDVSKQVGWHRNRGRWIVPGRAWRMPVYRPGGARHGGDVSLVCGFCVEREKARPDTATGGGQREVPERAKP
jgi:hypothetical protein